ncbi:MAG: DUF4388 domain-containing protein [Candidatus Omnitrophota bacterium]
MALRGNLKSFFLSSILQLLHNDKKTGALQLKNAEDEVQIILQDGNIIYAMSSNKEFRIGRLLRRKEIITSEQLQECLLEGKERKQALGKILVEKGFVTQEQLRQFIQQQVEEIVYGVFLWDSGHFLYKDARLDLSGMIVTFLDMTKIILESSRRIDEMSVLKKQITDDNLIFKPTSSAQHRVRNAEIKFGGKESAILTLIDGSRTVAQLIEKSALGKFDVYKILYSFISSGLIEKQEVLPPPAAPPHPEINREEEYTAIMTGYNNILQIIWQNLEPEMGKGTATLFHECKPEALPGQFDLFKNFHPGNISSVNILNLEENLKTINNIKNERLFISESFNRFILNILNRIPDILGIKSTQKMLHEIEHALPYLSTHLKNLNVKSPITEDIRKIIDTTARQILDKENKKAHSPLFSMFKKT